MSHFAGATIPAVFGLGAQANATGMTRLYILTGTAASTSNGSTEGTNLITYLVGVSGVYRLSAFMRVATTSNSNGAHTAAAWVTHSNPTDIVAATVQAATLDLTAAVGTTVLVQERLIYATAGTTITMYVSEIRASATTVPSVGSYDVHMAITGVS